MLQENLNIPTDNLRIKCPATTAFLDTESLGTGDLFISDE
jgi:hypothetical protein